MLAPEYRQRGKHDVVWCGPYKVPEVLNKGKNVKLDIPAPFDGLRVLDRDSRKPYINREGQPVWEFSMPPVKTGESPQLVKILARRRVGSTLGILSPLCSVVFRKTHARFRVDRRSLRLRYYIRHAPNFLSTSTFSSITVECHRC